jgi:hypothetical protein
MELISNILTSIIFVVCIALSVTGFRAARLLRHKIGLVLGIAIFVSGIRGGVAGPDNPILMVTLLLGTLMCIYLLRGFLFYLKWPL